MSRVAPTVAVASSSDTLQVTHSSPVVQQQPIPAAATGATPPTGGPPQAPRPHPNSASRPIPSRPQQDTAQPQGNAAANAPPLPQPPEAPHNAPSSSAPPTTAQPQPPVEHPPAATAGRKVVVASLPLATPGPPGIQLAGSQGQPQQVPSIRPSPRLPPAGAQMQVAPQQPPASAPPPPNPPPSSQPAGPPAERSSPQEQPQLRAPQWETGPVAPAYQPPQPPPQPNPNPESAARPPTQAAAAGGGRGAEPSAAGAAQPPPASQHQMPPLVPRATAAPAPEPMRTRAVRVMSAHPQVVAPALPAYQSQQSQPAAAASGGGHRRTVGPNSHPPPYPGPPAYAPPPPPTGSPSRRRTRAPSSRCAPTRTAPQATASTNRVRRVSLDSTQKEHFYIGLSLTKCRRRRASAAAQSAPHVPQVERSGSGPVSRVRPHPDVSGGARGRRESLAVLLPPANHLPLHVPVCERSFSEAQILNILNILYPVLCSLSAVTIFCSRSLDRPLCVIPFFCKDCHDVKHHCGHCGQYLGTKLLKSNN